eukprot:m.106870 g.106870  ORF g.106870 m.106870 type:complete len:686 (-) comp15164_c2_seq2:343-2400(-)
MRGILVSFAITLGLLFVAGEDVSLSDRIYTSLTGNNDLNTCTRLLSVDQVIGCSSPQGGAVGALFHIASATDLDNFAHASHDSYIAVITQDMFANHTTWNTLKSYKKLKGAMIYSPNGGAVPAAWSPDDMEPNAAYGLESIKAPVKWNLVGGGYGPDGTQGAHWQDFGGRPIFFLTSADTTFILDRLQANNQLSTVNPSYPLVAAELTSFMWAAKDAETCLRREFCDPLRSHNIWGTLRPYNGTEDVIMVTAQMDALAFFHDQAIGANSDGSGMIALLAAARLLGDKMNAAIRQADKNVMFVLFNGEAFGYIGSSKMANQMMRNPSNFPSSSYPLTFNQVPFLLEIGQLLSGDENLYTYTYDSAPKATQASTLLKEAAQNLTASMDVVPQDNFDIPPASLRMILHEMRKDQTLQQNFGGILVTDHPGSGFTNSYYNSRLDNQDNIDSSSNATVDKLCSISSVLAKTIWSMATGESVDASSMPLQQADCDYVRELLYCVTVDQQCQLVKDSVVVIDSRPGPISRYVGVKPTTGTLTRPVGFFFNQLAAAIAVNRNVTVNETDGCTANGVPPDYQRVRWRGNDVCYETATFTHLAWSPAFEGYYQLKPLGTLEQDYADGRDPRWSTWTESTWDPIKGRVFFVDSRASQLATVLIGLAWLFVCFGLVYLVQSRMTYDSHLLLESENDN